MKITNRLVHDINRILLHYGPRHQKVKAMEELQELNAELTKDVFDCDVNKGDVKQEIADVYVMLEQLKMIYHITDMEVIDVMKYKVNRQLGRMKEYDQ